MTPIEFYNHLKNLYLHWQPNNPVKEAQNLKELATLLTQRIAAAWTEKL